MGQRASRFNMPSNTLDTRVGCECRSMSQHENPRYARECGTSDEVLVQTSTARVVKKMTSYSKPDLQ